MYKGKQKNRSKDDLIDMVITEKDKKDHIDLKMII